VAGTDTLARKNKKRREQGKQGMQREAHAPNTAAPVLLISKRRRRLYAYNILWHYKLNSFAMAVFLCFYQNMRR
jgi:hypothetical protein